MKTIAFNYGYIDADDPALVCGFATFIDYEDMCEHPRSIGWVMPPRIVFEMILTPVSSSMR